MPDNAIKKRVYLNEFNVLMNNTAYLPLVSGLLQSYALTLPEIAAHYAFQPFIFHVDTLECIVSRYHEPAIAAFSCSMWNEQLNLAVAREVKRRWPSCIIIFGGPQVPHVSSQYMQENRFIDITVRGDGEQPFAEILHRLLESRDLSGIPGLSWQDSSGICRYNEGNISFNEDLDIYPSPYLSGVYDELMGQHPDMNFQAIIETNRGCPFRCTYCYWGKGGLNRKYRFHSVRRVVDQLEWCARNKMLYVFSADSNFGMHDRDREIAQKLVEVKKEYGYPEKFRVNYGKNTDDKIFDIGVLLHNNQLEKGITLSRQTCNPQVLKNIKRQNIRMETYSNLQRKFNDAGVPVYTELILGLPGETYESWLAGIEEMLGSGLKNQLFIYYLEIYENTDLADPAYQQQFGIKAQRIELNEIHCNIRRSDCIKEYQDIVVQHSAMTVEDWRKMLILSWVTMLLHSLKLGFFLMAYLVDRFSISYGDFLLFISELRMSTGLGAVMRNEIKILQQKIDNILKGEGRGNIMPGYGNIYWEVEEASFLRISGVLDDFYSELLEIISNFLDGRGISYDRTELEEAVRYQRMRIPSHQTPEVSSWDFAFSFPEYFEARFGSAPLPLRKACQTLTTQQTDFAEDKARYAKEVIIWGRKSGLMLTNATWQ